MHKSQMLSFSSLDPTWACPPSMVDGLKVLELPCLEGKAFIIPTTPSTKDLTISMVIRLYGKP